MAYIGSKPADAVLETDDITDGVITTSKLADNSVTTAKTSYSDIIHRNIIINGDMSIAQRGTSVTGKTADGYYTTDRWNHSINLGTWSIDQTTDVPSSQGFAKSHKMTCTTGGSTSSGTQTYLHTRLEGQNLQYLKKGTANAESLTLSFWGKSATTTGTMTVELFDTDNSRQISKQISLTTSWTKYTITYDADTTGTFNNDNGASLYVLFWVSAGSNFTSGTLSETWTSNTNGNRAVGQTNFAVTSTELYFTGIQLEAGQTASEFEFLPFDINLSRCNRFYTTSQGVDEFGGFSSGDENAIFAGRIGAFSNQPVHVRFPVRMRTTPTITLYSLAGTSGNISNTTTTAGSHGSNDTASTARVSESGLGYITGFGGSDGQGLAFQYEADAEL